MKLPFDFPKRRSPDPDEHEDRPLPTDEEIQAYLDNGPKGVKPEQPISSLQDSNITKSNPTEGQIPPTTESQVPIPTPTSGEIKG